MRCLYLLTNAKSLSNQTAAVSSLHHSLLKEFDLEAHSLVTVLSKNSKISMSQSQKLEAVV
jgi:hypothetical protein